MITKKEQQYSLAEIISTIKTLKEMGALKIKVADVEVVFGLEISNGSQQQIYNFQPTDPYEGLSQEERLARMRQEHEELLTWSSAQPR